MSSVLALELSRCEMLGLSCGRDLALLSTPMAESLWSGFAGNRSRCPVMAPEPVCGYSYRCHRLVFVGSVRKVFGNVRFVAGLNGATKWLRFSYRPQPSLGEQIMRMVAASSAAPVAQYISSPVTPLHSLDPRVKQAWLFLLVLLPSSSHIYVRSSLVTLLVFVTVWALPRQMWQDQLRRMLFLSGFVMMMMMLGTDGVPPTVQNRNLPPVMEGLPRVPRALGGYSYLLLKLGPLQVTKKGLSIATSAACLSFTVLQSASLCLATTTPEQLASALRWYLQPLRKIRHTTDELVLTLLLSLRFIALVFDEVRNLALAVISRGMHLRGLRLMDTLDTLFILVGRLFKNLFNHSEQISEAMIARGYKGVAADHTIYMFKDLRITWVDVCASLALVLLVGIASIVEILW